METDGKKSWQMFLQHSQRDVFLPNTLPEDTQDRLEVMDAFLRHVCDAEAARLKGHARDSVIIGKGGTGFKPMGTDTLLNLMDVILAAKTRKGRISLELGSGWGCWAILAAAMGFDSYGIDISPALVRIAQRNSVMARGLGLIAGKTRCEFAAGNYFTPDFLHKSKALIRKEASFKGSAKQGPSAYDALGIRLGDADIIYIYPWPGELRLICGFLATEAKKGAIIVMPGMGDDTPHGYLKAYPDILRTKPLVRGEWAFEGMIGKKL